MRYLDQYARIAAIEFEKELARVALTDAQAKLYSQNAGIMKILTDIRAGLLTPPSDAFEPYSLWFFPDSKFSDWAVRMYYTEKEEALFSAAAGLSNILSRLLKYSLRKRKAMLGEFDFSDFLFAS